MKADGGAKPKARGLGRGLSALFGDEAPAPSATEDGQVRRLPVERLQPGRFQPRRVFDEDALESLAHSIRQHGIIEPLIVRRVDGEENKFEIIAGERRWRAAQRAALHEVPAIVREADDRNTLELALIENLEREELTPIEEADAYRALIEQFGHTQEELAQRLARSRSHIANSLRLLTLPTSIKDLVNAGKLSAGHARTLVTAADPDKIAAAIIERGLSVRDAEKLAAANKTAKKPPSLFKEAPGAASAEGADADQLALERDLTEMLGMGVRIEAGASKGSGRLVLEYRSFEQLDDLIQRLNSTPG